MKKYKLLKLDWYKVLSIALFLLLLGAPNVFAAPTPGKIIDSNCPKGDVVCILKTSTINTTISIGNFLQSTSTSLASGWISFTYGILNNGIDGVNADKQFATSLSSKIKSTYIASKQLGLNTTASVGDSITSIGNFLQSVSTSLASGWSAFTYGLLNNITDSINGTKEFAVSVGDGAKLIGNGIAEGWTSTENFVAGLFDKKTNSLAVLPIIKTPTPITETPPVLPLSKEVATPTPPIPTPIEIIPVSQQIIQSGLTGQMGPRGEQGPRGLTGLQGPRGEAGRDGDILDTSSFVSSTFLDKQVTGIFDSINNSTQGLSSSLSEEVITKLLTVSGDATIGGNITITGNITGNVAGTINPSFTLGSIPFQGATGLAEDNANLFWDATNSRLGIGTMSPSSLLQVGGNGGADGSFDVQANLGDSWFSVAGGSIKFNEEGGITTAGNADLGARFNISPVNDSLPALAIRGVSAGVSDLLRISSPSLKTGDYFIIKSDGKVGIGTTTPVTSLEIAAGTLHGIALGTGSYPSWMGDNGIYMAGQLFAQGGYIISSGQSVNWGTGLTRITGHSGSGDGYLLRFITNDIERMRIIDNGNVGIGTTSPGALLDLKKDNIGSTSALGLRLINTTAATSGQQQYSPSIILRGNSWVTNVSHTEDWKIENQTVNWGEYSYFTISNSANGGPYTNMFQLRSDGTLTTPLQMDRATNDQNNYDAWISLVNYAAATVSSDSYSPLTKYIGNGWKTAAPAGSERMTLSFLGVAPEQGVTHPIGVAKWVYGTNTLNAAPETNELMRFEWGDRLGVVFNKYNIAGYQVAINGNVGIGTTSPYWPLTVGSNKFGVTSAGEVTATHTISLQGTDGSYPTMSGNTFSDIGWNALRFAAWRSRGTSASPTAVVSGDYMMLFDNWGYDGTTSVNGASFGSFVDGTVSTGIVPMKWEWSTMNTSGVKDARLTIKSSGNVGIGTTTPAYKLDVNGAINATSVLINGVAVGAGGTQWASGSGGVISYTGGNVGIGTATPGAFLDVAGLNTATANNTALTGVNFSTTSNYGAYTGIDDVVTRITATNATQIGLVIKQAASPTVNPFELRDSTNAMIMRITTSGAIAVSNVYSPNGTNSLGLGNGTDMTFQTNGLERMRILYTNGNVGIGNTSPTSLLDLVQTTTTGKALNIYRNLAAASTDSPLVNLVQDNSGDDQIALAIQNDGTGYGAFINQGTTGTSNGLVIYSNVDATVNSSLVTFQAANAAFDQTALNIINAGTGAGLNINQGTTGTNNGLYVYSNVDATVNNPLVSIQADNAAFDQNVLSITNDGIGYGLSLSQNGPSTGLNIYQGTTGTGSGIQVYSNVDATVNNPLINITADNAAFDQNVLNITNDGIAYGLNITGNGTGAAINAASSTLTSGSLANFTITGTGALTNQKALNVSVSGANATGAQTTYGAYISNIHAGTTSTNVGLYATATGGTTANYAAVFPAGNVGIGTTTPTEPLAVKSLSVNDVFSVAGGSISSRFIFSNSWNGSADYLNIRDSNKSVPNGLTVTDIGNVGIGTPTPGYALEVNASTNNIAYFHDGVTNTGCTLSGGGIIACSSDVRLKKNILDINYGLDTVMALRPVVYNWNYEADGSVKSLGFIAQEVEAIVPKLITTDTSGMKSLNTIGFVPILTKAIQEMNLKINDLSSLDTTSATSLGSLIKNFLADVTNGITDLYASVIHSDRVETKTLCVGDTCVTEEQFLEMVNKKISNSVTSETPTIPAKDICPNIDGTQETVPSGYSLVDGQCVEDIVTSPIDICPNIDGIQETIPSGMEVDGAGDCVEIVTPPIDICPNIDEIQETIPSGMEVDGAGDCVAIVISLTD